MSGLTQFLLLNILLIAVMILARSLQSARSLRYKRNHFPVFFYSSCCGGMPGGGPHSFMVSGSPVQTPTKADT